MLTSLYLLSPPYVSFTHLQDNISLKEPAAPPAHAVPNHNGSDRLLAIATAFCLIVSVATLTAYKLQDRHWLHTPSFALRGGYVRFDWTDGGVNLLHAARPKDVPKVMLHVPGWSFILIADCVLAYARYRQEKVSCAQEGKCRVCGYDLRATPTRCPECGTVPLLSSLASAVKADAELSWVI